MFSHLRRMLGRDATVAQDRCRRLSRRWRTQLELETLGARNLLSASPVFLNGSQLVIKGTGADDAAQVTAAGGQVTVDLNGTDFTFNAASVGSLKFKGKDGNDTFENDTALQAVARGGNGGDTLIGGTAADRLFGENGADHCSGGDGDDLLDGGVGDDTIDGEAGDDDCQGGDGDDDVDGGDGEDHCSGGAGNDDCSGGIGDDTVDGNSGSDQCDGGAGEDDLNGGGGDDVLDGGIGADDCSGGGGQDVSDDDPDDVGDDCENEDETEIELEALLTGATGATGEAEFSSEAEDGETEVEFEVEIEDAAPNSTFDVFADGTLIGQVTTDTSGEGEFESEDPALLTGLHDGSVIEVKDASGNVVVQGTLTTEDDDDQGEDDDDQGEDD